MKDSPEEKEKRVAACLEFIQSHPLYPIKRAAEDFRISRSLLRRRLDGVGAMGATKRRAHNAKLSAADEDALLRAMVRRDDGGKWITKRWVTDAANGMVKERAAREGAAAVLVRPRWVDAFVARRGLMVFESRIIRPTLEEGEEGEEEG